MFQMRVLNLLASGGIGGIETLCNNLDKEGTIDSYWCFLFQGGKIANEMKQRHPEKTYILEYNKKMVIKYINQVTRICKENQIDVLILHNTGTYCHLIFECVKKRLKKIKSVKFFHSCYEEKYLKPMHYMEKKVYYGLLNRVLHHTDLIVCVSNAVKQSYLKKFQIDENKMTIIYNGIADNFLTEPLASRTDKPLKNIIYIGRIEKVKGIDILINAFYQLHQTNSTLQLIVVGERKPKTRLDTTNTCFENG